MKPWAIGAVGLGLAACLCLQVYGLIALSALHASVERGSALAEMALKRGRAATTGTAGTQLHLETCAAPSSDEVRAIVQQELTKVAARPGAEREEDAELNLDPVENDAAFRQASSLVSSALAARVWGPQDIAQLRQLRQKLTPGQLDTLTTQLLPAINRQEVRVEGDSPF